MATYLSAEWIGTLDRVLAGNAELAVATASGPDVTVQYEVDNVTYHVKLGPSGVSAIAGKAQDPSVTFVQSAATAKLIHSGALSSEEAFITGQVTFHGDVQVLLEHKEAVSKLGDLTASIRQLDS